MTVNFDNIPPEMKALKNWVLWKYEWVKNAEGEERKTKIPYQVNGKKADSTDPETWATLEEAEEAFNRKAFLSPATAYSGFGFVFSDDSGFMGVDFDHIKDENGEWDPEALEEILSLKSYAEISPSGEGAHVICIAEIPGDRRRKGPREMYETARYFTVTGDHIEGSPVKINIAQRGVNALYKKWFESEKKETTKGATIPVKSKALSNSEILEIAGRAKNGEDFKSLYAGHGDTGDHSADDLKLCSMLAFYTQDPGQIDSLFCGSGLYRAKWDRRDYKERTINTAVQGLTATYNPEKKEFSGAARKEETPKPAGKTTEEIEQLIKETEKTGSTKENIKQAKAIIKNHIAGLQDSEAEELITFDVKEHFEFTGETVTILKKYCRECKKTADEEATRLKKVKEEEEKLKRIQEEEEEKLKRTHEEEENAKKEAVILAPDEEGINPVRIRKAEKTAAHIMKHGDPINYVLKTVKKIHTGDERTQEGICISIAGQSCLNTAGIQVAVNGESGSGKSHAVKGHLHLVPDKWIMETTLSAKAAYYSPLSPGMIMFSDDTEPDEDMEGMIKRATTNYQQKTKHLTVKKQEALPLEIPERVNWFLTSVDSNVSEQMLNRQLTFNTDEGETQKNAIFEVQTQEALRGKKGILEVTDRVLVCRRIYEAVKTQMFNVAIPFADIIECKDKSNARNYPMFLDMVTGYTIFKYEQRERDEEGQLLATVEDFNRAKKLFESQAEGIVTKLNDKERKILQFIATHRTATVNEIVSATGEKHRNVRNTLKGRADRANGGLLEKVTGLKMVDRSETHKEDDSLAQTTREEVFTLEKYNAWELFDGEFVYLDPMKRVYTGEFRKENTNALKFLFSFN